MRKNIQLSGDDGRPFTIVIDKFGRGVMTLYDETRLPIEGVSEAQNMYLDQDGVWTTRPGSSEYGQALTGPIDGGGTFTTYNSDNTSDTYVWVIDNGAFKISQDGGSWTTISGATFEPGWFVEGKQVSALKSDGVRAEVILLTNGYNSMSYYDIAGGVLGTFSSLSAPTGLTATKGGLSSGSYNVYYKVTAVNAVGETLASSEASVSGGIDKTRDNWTLGTHTVALDWNDVVGAKRYNIYYSDITGEEVYLDSVVVSSYTDTGEATPNPYQSVPEADSTAGNKYSTLALSGNRIFGTRDPNLPYRVGWTGTGQYMGAFNPFYGGGYVDLEKGGVERPEKVIHFRSGKGDAAAMVLSSDPNGAGSQTIIQLTTLTVDTLTIVIPVVSKQQGSIGTRSPRGVVEYDNSVYMPSPKGFHNIGSRQSILNVLVTADLSSNIRTSVLGLNNGASDGICGIAHNGRIYWSVPYGSSENNEIWVMDVERKNAWALPWTIGVKHFFEYTETDGTIHLLAIPVSGDHLIRLGDVSSGDSGTAFNTVLGSGLIHGDKNHMSWVYLNKAYVELADPTGVINFTVSGTKRGKAFSTIGSREITGISGVAGFGDDIFGNVEFGDSSSTATTFTQPSVKKVLKINKTLNNFRWNLTTETIASRYALIQVVFIGTLIPVSDPAMWKQ